MDEKKLLLLDAPDVYEDISKELKVTYSEHEFIFVIESWGQLSPAEIIDAGIARMQKNCKEFDQLVNEM